MALLKTYAINERERVVEARSKFIKIFIFLAIFASGFLVASNAQAATYYVRADGTAANKTTAIGPSTDATASMNITIFNAQTFSDDDVIVFSSRGGEFDGAAVVIPSGGSTPSHKITYQGEDGYAPTFNGQDTVDTVMTVSSKNNLEIKNIIITHALTSGLDIYGTSNGVVVSNATSTYSGNQAFQNRNTASTTYNNIYGANNVDDGFSMHDGSTAIINTGVFDNNNNALNWIASSTLTASNITINGCSGECIYATNGGVLPAEIITGNFTNVVVNDQSGTFNAPVVEVAGAGTTLTINGLTVSNVPTGTSPVVQIASGVSNPGGNLTITNFTIHGNNVVSTKGTVTAALNASNLTLTNGTIDTIANDAIQTYASTTIDNVTFTSIPSGKYAVQVIANKTTLENSNVVSGQAAWVRSGGNLDIINCQMQGGGVGANAILADTGASIINVSRSSMTNFTNHVIDTSAGTTTINSSLIYNLASAKFAVAARAGTTTITNLTVNDGADRNGKGLFALNSSASLSVTNSILSELNVLLHSGGGSRTVNNNILYASTSADVGTWTFSNDTFSNPLLTSTSTSNFTLQSLSSAIDAGTTTGITSTTTDFAGHPIYGTPDIGAYEYQPPFKIGTDKVDPTGNIRIYGDGQYRYTTATSSTMSVNFSATPAETWTYAASTTRPEWLNISSITWGTTKQWTTSSSIATTTIYSIGDLTPNKIYTVTVDGATSTAIASTSCSNGTCTAGADGKLVLTYTGGYSTHTFAVTPDTTAPSITLTSPATSFTASSTITLTATSTDDVGIAGVTFYRGTTAIGSEITATSAPNTYSTTWNTGLVTDGSYDITAVARDTSNNYATSSPAVAVTVDNTAPVRSGGSPSGTLSLNTTLATISLTTALESATCKYSTTAGTAYNSMTALTTTGGTTHSKIISGLTNGGSYIYYVKCQDAVGNMNATDYTISFTVAADTTSPTVSVTAPSNNSTFSGNAVTISADATDDVSVSGVQFKLDTNTLIGSEDTSSPYSVTWDSTSIADGTHTIVAVARDGTGNYATSSVVTVTVHNAVSTPAVTNISSSGGSAQSQVNNLIAMGNYALAQQIAKQYGITIPMQNILVNVSPTSSGSTFTRTLKFGMTSVDVKQLQVFLNAQGFTVAQKGAGSPGHETTYFGPATKAALMKFQLAHRKEILDSQGLVAPTGIFASGSMKVANALLK